MIQDSKVHVCDACGHRVPGHHQHPDRPATLAGLPGVKGGQGIMGTVDVPDSNGDLETKPFYAHRAACVRKAIENVIDGLLPPDPDDTEHDQ